MLNKTKYFRLCLSKEVSWEIREKDLIELSERPEPDLSRKIEDWRLRALDKIGPDEKTNKWRLWLLELLTEPKMQIVDIFIDNLIYCPVCLKVRETFLTSYLCHLLFEPENAWVWFQFSLGCHARLRRPKPTSHEPWTNIDDKFQMLLQTSHLFSR